MRKITLLFTAVLIASVSLNAQKKKKLDPKYEHHFKVPAAITTDEFNLEFFNIQSQAEFCKLAVKITNNTNDFIVFDKVASKFNFDFGQFSDKKKDILIQPNDSKKKVLEANGHTAFQVEKFSIDFDGFSLVPIKGTVSEMEDFQVPASKNMIETDLFKVALKKSSLRTQEAVLIFECTYLGNKIGLINPSKLVIKVDGAEKEWANDNRKEGSQMLKKGDKVKLKAIFHIPGRIADMQFANMTILWKDTFVETEAKKLAGHSVNFEIDPGMTNGKN
jgi:hypothetical protein